MLIGVELNQHLDPDGTLPVSAYFFADVGKTYSPLSEKDERRLAEERGELKYQVVEELRQWPEIQEALSGKKPRYNLYVKAYKEGIVKCSHIDRCLEEILAYEHQFICAVLRFNQKIANQFGDRVFGVTREDLVQAGNKALVECVPNFDPDKGRLTTYVRFKIEGGMQDFIRETSRTVKCPPKVVTQISTILAANRNIKDGSTPTVDRLKLECERLGRPLSRDKIEKAMLLLGSNPAPLDAPRSVGGADGSTKSRTLAETLADASVDTEDTVGLAMSKDKSVEELLDLPAQEAAVLYFRYLDVDYVPKTKSVIRPLNEVCDQFERYRLDPRVYPYNRSREYIRGVERRGLMRLRMNSKYFWRRFYDEQLSKYITIGEWTVLWEQTIAPKCEGFSPLGWYTTALTICKHPKYVIETRRRAMTKVRKHNPELVDWLTHH